MQNTKSKNQNEQLHSIGGRTVEITTLLESLFDSTSPDNIENTLFTMFDRCINPIGEYSGPEASNDLFAIREIVDLVRKLEIINNQLQGGESC